jgi:hypothetical protein
MVRAEDADRVGHSGWVSAAQLETIEDQLGVSLVD